jgi:hypothetical protein
MSKLQEMRVGPNGTQDWKPGTLIGFFIWCPGCEEPHGIYTEGLTKWWFNGDRDYPTFTPSLLVHGDVRPGAYRCHSFITRGSFQFLADCGHKLAGKTVEIPDYPENWKS